MSNKIEADRAVQRKRKFEPVDVGVIYLGQKSNFGGTHWVFGGQEKLQPEDTTYIAVSEHIQIVLHPNKMPTFVRRIDRTSDYDVKVAKVILIRSCTNAFHRFCEKSFSFLPST